MIDTPSLIPSPKEWSRMPQNCTGRGNSSQQETRVGANFMMLGDFYLPQPKKTYMNFRFLKFKYWYR